MDYHCIDPKILFIDSSESNIIQISDICAYSIRKQSEKYWNKCAFKDDFYWGYKQIRNRIHTNPNNPKELYGYGIVCFPEKKS